MSQDSEKLKTLVNFKQKLEKRIEELNAELEESQGLLEAVNSVLLEKGFKRGDIKEVKEVKKEAPKEEETPTVHVTVEEEPPEVPVAVEEEAPATPRPAEPESVIQLKTMDDEPLAIIYVDKEALHVLPDERKKFSVSTPPFQPFLVERVLAKMQEKDSELVRRGELTADKMFAYNIVSEGDLIREIVIRNVDEERLKELRSSIRWTLEKMYEKTKG
jgi:hypothetical protein